jgi:hypothetical protein
MKNFLRKSVIYLLTFMMFLPTWAVTGLMTAEKARADSLPSIIINEFVSHPASGSEWVEILNTTNSPINLSGWNLTELSNPSTTATENLLLGLSGSIPAMGLRVFNVSGLNDSGDSVGLYNGSYSNPSNIVGRVSYGNVSALYKTEATGNIYVEDAPSQSKSVALIDSDYLSEVTPTKGWFNSGVVTLDQISIQLLAQGISSNILLLDPTNATNLYFEKAGLGKITFEATLNLTDQKTSQTLGNLSTALEFEEGSIKFDPMTGDSLKTLGGKLEMYGLSFATTPTIYVDGIAAGASDVDSINYVGGTLSFNAKHFSTYSVSFEAPELDNVGFTSNGSAVNKDADGKYYILTDGNASTNYGVQFNSETTASKALESEYFGLYLVPLSGQTEALISYYSSKSEPWKTYLTNAAAGTAGYPFALIKGNGTTSVKLVDAAQHQFLPGNPDPDMTIPGDYPEGAYNVSGDIVDTDGLTSTVSFTLIVDRTAPDPISYEDYFVKGYFGSDNERLVDVYGEAEANINISIRITPRPEVLGEEIIVNTQSDSNGTFSVSAIDISSLSGNNFSIKPTLTDFAGNQESTSFDWYLNFGLQDDFNFNELGSSTVFDLSKDAVIDPIDLGGVIQDDGLGKFYVDFTGGLFVRRDFGNGILEMTINPKTIMDVTGAGIYFNAPKITTSNVTIDPSTGKSIDAKNFIEIGSTEGTFIFDQAVKLVFKDKANDRIGFIKDGVFTEITQLCDDVDNPTFSPTGECKAITGEGKDLTVLTKHFTKFGLISEKNLVLSAPDFSVSTLDVTKTITIKWTGTGEAESYRVWIGDFNELIVAETGDLGRQYTYSKTVSEYGRYNIIVKSYKNGVYSSNTEMKAAEIKALSPATSSSDMAASSATSLSVAPKKAVAASNPSVAEEKKVETSTDDNGKIKGTEEDASDSEEGTNWTPWIILFVLIVLAGAVTGGYFYWFAGKDDVRTKVREKTVVAPKKVATKKVEKTKKSPKKTNRW